MAHQRVSDLSQLGEALQRANAENGPFMVEIDMLSIGKFKTIFAGPPVSEKEAAKANA